MEGLSAAELEEHRKGIQYVTSMLYGLGVYLTIAVSDTGEPIVKLVQAEKDHETD